MRIFFLLLAVLFLFFCGKQVIGVQSDPTPTRQEVTRSAMRASVWRFVYCVDPAQEATKLVSFLEGLANNKPFGKQIEVVNCTEINVDSLGSRSFSLFGNRMPADANGLPIRENLLVGRHQLADADVTFIPYYKNPWGAGNTVTAFYWAQQPDKLVEMLRQELDGNWDGLFWPKWGYELFQANGDRVYGSFADNETSWDFDPNKEVALLSPNLPVYDLDGLQLFAYDGATSNQEVDLISNGLRKLSGIIATLRPQQDTAFPEVRIYPNLERIGLRRNNMAPIQYDPAEGVLHLVPSFLTEGDLLTSFSTWHALVAEFAEVPVVPRTEGRRAPQGGVPGKDLSKAIAALQHQASTSLGAPYQDCLTEVRRLEATGILSRPEQESPSDIIRIARARHYALAAEGQATGQAANIASGQGPQVGGVSSQRVPPIVRRAAPEGKLAGMTFAHQGYRVHNGYGGEKIKPSLDSLAQLNVNALAIVPYTFMRNPNQPTTLSIPGNAGSENDWATICSIREAKGRDWFVLLKPQIWVGGGYWPGSVDFTTEEEWDTFFDNYTYWIMHYALLAEREQVEALCLGTELVKTTGKHPDRWREIIRKVRQVYGGQLTYAANWGEEFDNFTFWDELDAIGLNSYYPLAEGDSPTDAELLEGANRWLKMAAEVSQRQDRPLWLTEVGYRSVTAAWQHPHAEAGERDSSLVDQARCYRALWTAAANYPELEGAFIWKWPSYIGYGGGGRTPYRRFTPGGKPAAQELADFYQRWR